MHQVQISIRMPEDLKVRLKAEATRRETTVSGLASAILTEGLVIYEDQEVSIPHMYEILLLPREAETLIAQGYNLEDFPKKDKRRGARLPLYEKP